MKMNHAALMLSVALVALNNCRADIKVFGPGQNRETDIPWYTINDLPERELRSIVISNIYQYKNISLAAEITIPKKNNPNTVENLFATVSLQGGGFSEDVELKMHEKRSDNVSTTVYGTTSFPTGTEFTGASGPISLILSLHGGNNVKKPDGWIQFQGDLLVTPPTPTGAITGLPPIIGLKPGETTVPVSGVANVAR